MADLSLGPLRIANPDDNPPDTPTQSQHPNGSTYAPSPLREVSSGTSEEYFRNNEPRSENAPAMYTTEAASHVPQDSNNYASTTPRRATVDRTQQRQSMAQTYQDQQQSQFPQYPTMMPQNLHDTRMSSTRPGSQYYTQLPVGLSGNGITRQGSYRARAESGGSSAVPSRTASERSPRPSGAAMARDDAHTDRYGQTQYSQGALPPRRASRGIASSRMASTASSNTPVSTTPMSSQTPLSSSPYNLDGGPLSSSEEWKDRGAAVGVQHGYDANGRPVVKPIKKGVKDFNFGQTLGEGSYSTVLAATDRQTLKEYAIKVLDKRHIIKEKKVKYVNIEKETLNRLTDHPGVVRLYYTFQDERSLYFVLDLCSGGELLGSLRRLTTFDEECTRFYGAQILDTIEYMHSKGVIHRDLKPENVLLDENKHIKITDFGTAKMLTQYKDANGRMTYAPDSIHTEDRASSFVGTAEYVSPELLTDKTACKGSDLWAFGCIIYQLLAGRPPFKAANEYLTFQKIVALEYDFPRGFPELAQDLVERLLVLDPQQRLSLEHVKTHPFFEGAKWGKALWQQKAPILKPYQPPPNPPINLNGSSSQSSPYPPNINAAHSTHPTILPPVNTTKPKPRLITELPPPSQLDIEWSPVLTRNNERILKLGNLAVISSPQPHSPGHDGGNVLSRFFSGSTTKKRQRLVMVTSSARVIVAAAGGEEKKSKLEIGLLSPGTEVTTTTDSKGVTNWVVNTVRSQFSWPQDVQTNLSVA